MPDKHTLLVYGAGQHGLVVAEAAEAAGWLVLGFLDQSPIARKWGEWPVFEQMPPHAGEAAVIVAIGDNMARRRIAADLQQTGLEPTCVIHPAAWISPSANLGPHVYIGAQATVNANANLDTGVIVNTGAIVEHDCQIGAFTHIAPRATLTGGVSIGDLCLIGAGAVINPGLSIGDNCTVGAGAVVVRDVPSNQTVVGIPAKPIVRRLNTAG